MARFSIGRVCTVGATLLVGAGDASAHLLPDAEHDAAARLPIFPSIVRDDLQGYGRVWTENDIVVIEDDGTMISDGRFVVDRVLPAFYTSLPDTFDFVSLFGSSSLPDEMYPAAAQFEVRTGSEGLGRYALLNRNGRLGTHTDRLKSVQLMSGIRLYGENPSDPIPSYSTEFNGLDLLASESLHWTGCWVNIDEVISGADLEGRLGAHWSFFFHTDGSVMEGCRWQDNGDGSFTSVGVLDGLSELDEYLLGLRPPEQVSPMFVIANPDPVPPSGARQVPFTGFTTWGDRIDFTIDDIIAQNGPRLPAADTAQHDFRMAFVLVIPPGGSPPDEDLAFLDAFRLQWEQWFHDETEGLGTMDTTIPSIPVSAHFRPDRFAGNAPLRVRFENLSGGVRSGFAWEFGAAYEPSTQVRPFLSFSDGSHDVTLTVQGVSGPAVLTVPDAVSVGGFDSLYSSDFEEPSEWMVGDPQTSTSGAWEWGDPEGTFAIGVPAQPEDDASLDGTHCWATGLAAGSFPSQNDVDGGVTTLLSPVFDLASAVDPLVSYVRWYSNYLSGSPEEDEFIVQVSDDGGSNWVDLERLDESDTRYHTVQFRLRDFVTLSAQVRFRFQASDYGGESLVEAAIDDFEIIDRPMTPRVAAAASGPRAPLELRVSPNPSHGNVVLRFSRGEPGPMRAVIYNAAGRLVRELRSDTSPRLTWDGADATGRVVAAGVYTVVVGEGRDRSVRKVVRVR